MAATGQRHQHNDARAQGRVHAVQHGNQLNVEHMHLTVAARSAERVVSVAPPFGRRDPRLPLRGRDGLVASLWSALSAPYGATRVRVLCGMTGSGKTSVALELAHRAAVGGVDVWWVDGSSELIVSGGMLAVARQVGVAGEALRHGDAADRLWRGLTAQPTPWLLVIDNVDRPDLLAGGGVLADGTGWLRPVTGGRGMVVVTTRDGDPETWGTWCLRDTVGTLSPDDGAQVLIDWVPGAGTPDDARALAVRLGGLPLALRLSGSYLAETMTVPWSDPGAVTTFRDYTAAMGAEAVPSVADRHREVVDRALELSVDLLAERGVAQARPLLRVLSEFADAPVPYRLLLDPVVLASMPGFAGLTAAHLWRLIRALVVIGLVDLAPADDAPDPMLATVRTHPLVRRASRRSDDEPAVDGRPIVAGLLLRLAGSGELGPTHDPAAWPRWQSVTAHVLDLAGRLPAMADAGLEVDYPGVLAAAIDTVRHLRARGLFQAAEPAYRRLYDVGTQVLRPQHPHLMQIRHELAYTLYYRGEVVAAEREFVAALEMRAKALGVWHPDTLTTQQALGRIARRQGRYADATATLRAVHEVQRDLLGFDHPDTLTTQHQLARALLGVGEVAAARAEFQRVLWMRRRVLGRMHPDTFTTRHQLGSIAIQQGRYGAAEHTALTVGRNRRLLLGDRHPDTLHSRNALGVVLAAQGRWAAAEAELRVVLDARREVFGDRHPETLTTRHHLAAVLAGSGRRQAAIAEYRWVLADRRDVLGADHPDTRIIGARLRDLGADGQG